MILVGISGKRRSGKTTLARKLESSYGFTHYSLAKVLKQEIRDIYGLTEAQTDGDLKEAYEPNIQETPRELMITYGQYRREVDANYWIDRVKAQMLAAPQAQFQKAVISDIRFKNEAQWIKDHGGFLVRLERAPELTGDPIDDPSECELDDFKDWTLRIPESSNVDMTDVAHIATHINDLLPIWIKTGGRLHVA